MVHKVSTDGIPVDLQLEFWREAINDYFIRFDMKLNSETPSFAAQFIQHTDGPITFSEVVSDGHTVVRKVPGQMDGNDDYYLLLIQRHGTSQIEQAGRSVLMRPGDLVLCHSCSPYSMNMPLAFHHDVLMIPGNIMRHALRTPERYTALAVPNQKGAGRLFMSFIDSLRTTLPELDERSASSVANATVDLLCAALLATPMDEIPLNSSLQQYHLQRLRLYVQTHLADPDLSVERIATALQLSKRHLHALFDSQPTTLNAWIWKERVDAARRALAAPANAHRSITDIAHSLGFKSSAHFSRLFQSAVGMSPRDFRSMASGEG